MKHLKRLISALLLTAVLATAVFASAATIKDVPAKNWAYPYVSKMVDMDIMQTHDGGYFYPDLPTSRGEFVLYLWRAMHAPAIGVDAGFTDVSWDDPWSGAVNWAVGAGITNGVSPTRFDPYGDLTREQAFTFLYRAMDYLGVAPTYGENHEFYTPDQRVPRLFAGQFLVCRRHSAAPGHRHRPGHRQRLPHAQAGREQRCHRHHPLPGHGLHGPAVLSEDLPWRTNGKRFPA